VARLQDDSIEEGAQVQLIVALKDLVAPDNGLLRENQNAMAEHPSVLLVLTTALRRQSQNYAAKLHASCTLAQIAWNNKSTSEKIAGAPGLLEGMAHVLHLDGGAAQAQVYTVQEQCAIAMGNSAANSRKASETFASDRAILQGFSFLLEKKEERDGLQQGLQRVQETTLLAVKNIAATSQAAAHQIARHGSVLESIRSISMQRSGQIQSMAIGAINSVSRSRPACALLVDMGIVDDVLLPCLFDQVHDGAGGRAHDLRILTVTSALANTLANTNTLVNTNSLANTQAGGGYQWTMQAWLSKAQGKAAVANLVECLCLSLGDSRWEQVSFSPPSVITPLYNILLTCPSLACPILAECYIVKHLCLSLDLLMAQLPSDTRVLESLGMCVRMLNFLATHLGEGCMRVMRVQGVISQVQGIRFELIARASSLSLLEEETDVWRLDGLVAELEDLAVLLTLAPLALCMGTHKRIGENSSLYQLDRDVLSLIGRSAFLCD